MCVCVWVCVLWSKQQCVRVCMSVIECAIQCVCVSLCVLWCKEECVRVSASVLIECHNECLSVYVCVCVCVA